MTVIKSTHLTPEKRWPHPQAIILTIGCKIRQGVTALGHLIAGEVTANSGRRRQSVRVRAGSPAQQSKVLRLKATGPHTPGSPPETPRHRRGPRPTFKEGHWVFDKGKSRLRHSGNKQRDMVRDPSNVCDYCGANENSISCK